MPTDAQKITRLDKVALGKADTNTNLPDYSEDKTSRFLTINTEVWIEDHKIPAIAPLATTGVVQYVEELGLTALGVSTPNAFYSASLKDCIPYYWGGNGSGYAYELTTSTGATIPFGPLGGDWVLDTQAGVLRFYGTLPAGVDQTHPPKVTFHKYVGRKGVAAVPRWASELTYAENDIINHNGSLYKSINPLPNHDNDPAAIGSTWWAIVSGGSGSGGIADWAAATLYTEGQVVTYKNLLFRVTAEHTSAADFASDLGYLTCLSTETFIVHKVAHGLLQFRAVYYDSVTPAWKYASASAEDTVASHIILERSADYMLLTNAGRFTYTAHGLGSSGVYYVAASSPADGTLTATVPPINNPALYIFDANTFEVYCYKDTIMTEDGGFTSNITIEWSNAVVYTTGMFVTYLNKYYRALQANTNVEPTSLGSDWVEVIAWSAVTDYPVDSYVLSGPRIYKSIHAQPNLNQNPVTQTTYWQVQTLTTATLDTFLISVAKSCEWNLKLNHTGNDNVGKCYITADWSSTTAIADDGGEFIKTIGNLDDVTLSFDNNVSVGYIRLRASVLTTGWTIQGERNLLFRA